MQVHRHSNHRRRVGAHGQCLWDWDFRSGRMLSDYVDDVSIPRRMVVYEKGVQAESRPPSTCQRTIQKSSTMCDPRFASQNLRPQRESTSTCKTCTLSSYNPLSAFFFL